MSLRSSAIESQESNVRAASRSVICSECICLASGGRDRQDIGAQGQARGDPGDEILTPLLARHRQARQAFPRPLVTLRLVPARHLPRHHSQVPERTHRTVVRRLRRRVVQAAQHHPAALVDPTLDRRVPPLGPLLNQ